MGLITLNRHEALNALSLNMVIELSHLLNKWKADATVQAIAAAVVDATCLEAYRLNQVGVRSETT